MTSKEFVRDFTEYCEKNANPEITKKYARYFKEGFESYGLTEELLKSKVESVIQDSEITLGFVFKAARELLKSRKFEFTSFACLLTLKFIKQFNKSTFTEISRWFDIGISNWAHTDLICSEIIGGFFLKKGIIDYSELSDWRTADNPFKRRAVPVSLIKIMKITPEIQPFLDFIEPMMMDKVRVVHQGLGWFVREAWKLHPGQVEELLLKWKNISARLIFQYATEKMTPEQKARFRKDKN